MLLPRDEKDRLYVNLSNGVQRLGYLNMPRRFLESSSQVWKQYMGLMECHSFHGRLVNDSISCQDRPGKAPLPTLTLADSAPSPTGV